MAGPVALPKGAAWVSVLILAIATTSVPVWAVASEASSVGSTHRVLGYYVPYHPASWASLQAHAHLVDLVAVQSLTVDACGGVGSSDDQTLKRFARSRGIPVLPSLVTFSGWLNHRILTDEAISARVIDEVVDYVVAEGYQGFDLDLEGVWPDDRAPYTAFTARLATALHDRNKLLAAAIPAKTADTTTGWGGAFDYAALGAHADLFTVMAYEYHGGWGEPGPIAPYDWVEQVAAFATSQIPPEKVLLGLAFYGYDWNTTSGGGRYLGNPEAAALSERYSIPITLDPATRSETMRYRAPSGESPPRPVASPALRHEITQRRPPACPITEPSPTRTPTPRPAPAPDPMQEHEVWLEGTASAEARLPLADRYQTGGVAMWRLGHEDASLWPVVERWRRAAS
jgi:Glycosyl hydrolases family 18